MEKRSASRITASRSLKSTSFHLTGWRLSHSPELPGDLPVPLECHTLTLNTIELQLSDADTSMLQCSALFQIPLTCVHFMVDYASNTLAFTAKARLTFNDEEEVVVIRNGLTPKEDEEELNDSELWLSIVDLAKASTSVADAVFVRNLRIIIVYF